MQRTQTRVPDGKKKRNKLPLWNGAKISINVRFTFGKMIYLWKTSERRSFQRIEVEGMNDLEKRSILLWLRAPAYWCA